LAEPVEVAAGDEAVPVDPAAVDTARVEVATEEAACEEAACDETTHVEAAAVDETTMAADLAPQIPELEFGVPAALFR
jgi:hypothetical protein